MNSGEDTNQHSLDPYLTRLGIWAFSIGTSIGWGSFIVTCNTYLLQAGIMGTVLGLLAGMAVILVINHNLCYMMEREPSAGGIYSYGKRVQDDDTGFLVGWFLLLTYFAVLWANITSLPLFARRFIGAIFEFGYCYTVFGYDVYIGEVLLSAGALALIGLLCSRSRMIPQYIMIAMALVFTGSVAVCFILCLTGYPGSGLSFDPLYIPDKAHLSQIVRIAVISPWAFIGFENVSHFTEEVAFPVKKIRGAMIASVILTTVFYILMTLMSVTAYPSRYGSWIEYISDMNNLSGIESVPAFYAVSRYMGDSGVTLLMLALLCIIVTSMIGNLTAISRLIFAFGRDNEWTGSLSKVNRYHIPGRAILIAVTVSCFIPFLGRTAISWIVDVTTLGATIIYGFLSYFVLRDAKASKDRTEIVTGTIGFIMMAGFAIFLLAPKLMKYEAMAPESYLLFAGWSLLGLLFFRVVLLKDRKDRYGHSTIVWIFLLLLMLMTIMMWENSETELATKESMVQIGNYYQQHFQTNHDPGLDAVLFLKQKSNMITDTNSRGMTVSYSLFLIAVFLMLGNYMTANKREHALITELDEEKEAGLKDPLTGVKNKKAYLQWEENINNKIARRESEPFAVVVCDINGLKWVNDSQGHREGDAYICRVCTSICNIFAHSPVFRYGGDEFAVILSGQDFDHRISLMEIATAPPDEDEDSEGSTFAAGISEFRSGEDESLQDVFERADREMYENKRDMKRK